MAIQMSAVLLLSLAAAHLMRAATRYRLRAIDPMRAAGDAEPHGGNGHNIRSLYR